MSPDQWLLIALLAAGAYGIRFTGLVSGAAIARRPRLRTILGHIPGCLLVALVAASLADAEQVAWLAALVALAVAWASNSIVLTMVVGFAALYLLRQAAALF